MIADLLQDLRYAARNLRRKPGFTAMVAITLALGIAANVSIFTLVDTALLRSLPVSEPEELVVFSDGGTVGRALGPPPAIDGKVMIYSYPLYERLRDGARGMKLAAQDGQVMVSIVRGPGTSSEPSEVGAEGRCVTANFFEVLGIRAHRGRTFLPEDERAPADSPSLVLSHGYWQRRFGGDPQIVGAKLEVNAAWYTVVGVTPPGFTGATVGGATDFWVPTSTADAFIRYGMPISDPEYSWLHLLGRLEPGTTLASAQANANAVLSSFMSDLFPPAPGGAAEPRHIELLPGATGLSKMRQNFREPLLILMAGVALLQLIVCLNVSHLMLARALSRQQEMSIRAALGATRARLVRQLLTEGLVLALLGASAGLLGARWLTDALASFASSKSGAFGLNLVVDIGSHVKLFALGLALGTALLLGLVPAVNTARGDLQQALHATARATTAGGSRHRLSRVLLVSQVAFSLILLVAAGLLGASLGNLRNVQLGMDREHLLVAHLGVEMVDISEERAQFLYEDIPRRIAGLPGVLAASLSEPGVLTGSGGALVEFPGTDLPAKGFAMSLVTRGYFDALGVRIVRGRGFQTSDSRDAPRVAIVNETMASEFGGRDALGQRIRLEEGHDVEVVGIASDARTRSIRRSAEPHFFLHAPQPHGTGRRMALDNVQVRALGDPLQLAQQVRRAVAEAQSDMTLLNVRTLNEQVDRVLVRERLLALLASAFGLGALFLVAVGLYGVISQWATQRTREIGVRMALGATPGGVKWLVLRQALWLVLIGLALGVPAAVAVAQLLGGLLFEVKPVDVRALVGSVLLLVAVATLAAFLPARRASRLDPVTALRCD